MQAKAYKDASKSLEKAIAIFYEYGPVCQEATVMLLLLSITIPFGRLQPRKNLTHNNEVT